ncbi:hypothetical protein ABMY26_23720 [Azospirillum sp. HJ39]|uniref:hypothetical protein n=1 Tax=Azospirillum sp. HJ39 TaxID=3159496 RepID=UPI003555EE39
MSQPVEDMVWAADIRSTPKFVLLRLARYSADDGTSVYPSIGSVAAAVGMSEVAVRKAVQELLALGVLSLVALEDQSTHRPREYRIMLDALAARRAPGTPITTLPPTPSTTLGGGGNVIPLTPKPRLPPTPSTTLGGGANAVTPSPQPRCPVPPTTLPHPLNHVAPNIAAIASAAAATADAGNGDKAVLSPTAIIDAFDAALVEAFGPERARRRPADTDQEVAAAWIDQGVDLALCEGLFISVQARRKKLHQEPVGSLAWFSNRVAAQLDARSAPFPELTASRSGFALSEPAPQAGQREPMFGRSSPATRPVWRLRLTEWRDKSVWLPAWGAKPDEHGCEAPTDLIAEIFPQRELL